MIKFLNFLIRLLMAFVWLVALAFALVAMVLVAPFHWLNKRRMARKRETWEGI